MGCVSSRASYLMWHAAQCCGSRFVLWCVCLCAGVLGGWVVRAMNAYYMWHAAQCCGCVASPLSLKPTPTHLSVCLLNRSDPPPLFSYNIPILPPHPQINTPTKQQNTHPSPPSQPQPHTHPQNKNTQVVALWAEMDAHQLLFYAKPKAASHRTVGGSGSSSGSARLALPVLRLPLKVGQSVSTYI